jgi:hypothetical protein
VKQEVNRLLKKKKRLILILVPLLLVSILFIYDANLDVYTTNSAGSLVYKNKEFHTGYNTHKKFYLNGERNFEIDKLIGKTDNSRFFGFKESVWSIKGKSANEVVFVKGLMIEGIYERK